MSTCKNVLMVYFLMAMGSLLLVIFLAGSSAENITVDDDGGADHISIQDAVNASEKGDTIHVFEGTYQEHVVVNRSISIIGNGSNECTIDAGGDGVALLIEDTNANVSGFTLTGGGCCGGAGLKIKTSRAFISNITCSGNLMAGLHLINSKVDVTDSQFLNNAYGILGYLLHDSRFNDISQEYNTWGIYLADSSNDHLSNAVSSHNVLYGIYLEGSSRINVENSSCNDNDNGIGLIDSIECRLSNVNCSDNGGIFGNGVELKGSDNTTIVNSTFNDNIRGILACHSAKGTVIRECTIEGNREFGIDATSNTGVIVDAVENRWGDPSGPYHPMIHPGGRGDNVSNGISFYPWNGTLFLEPLVEVSWPENGTTVNGTVTFRGGGGDEDGDVELVELSFDGTTWQEVNGTEQWSFVWNTSSLENGSRTIRFRAFDGMYYSAEVRLDLTVENDPENDGNHGEGGGGGGGDDDDDGDDDFLSAIGISGIITVLILLALFFPRTNDPIAKYQWRPKGMIKEGTHDPSDTHEDENSSNTISSIRAVDIAK